MHPVDVAIIGTGSVGIAYYLVRDYGVRRVALMDPLPPMRCTFRASQRRRALGVDRRRHRRPNRRNP
jgi:threonine dehydrogenase-like Zn-dependent dehydrogenase